MGSAAFCYGYCIHTCSDLREFDDANFVKFEEVLLFLYHREFVSKKLHIYHLYIYFINRAMDC